MYERVAKNVGCTVDEIIARHAQTKEENRSSLSSLGEEEFSLKTLRMCASSLRAEKARLNKSGCKMYEGMFISYPRYQDWGRVFYNKYEKMIAGLPEEGRSNLVAQGLITLYETDDVDGGYTCTHNPSLTNKTPFEEGTDEMKVSSLPKQAKEIGNTGTYFVCIENKSSPTYPSGSVNYAYGKIRNTKDIERTSLFVGRLQGTSDAPSLITFRMKGALAEQDIKTFSPCNIPASPSKDGKTAYGKAGVTVPSYNDSIADIFSAPPMTADGKGIIAEHADVLAGLDDIPTYLGALSDKEKWSALTAVLLEVGHIDPRENGGYILTCNDLDLMSMSPPVDIYVNQLEESKVSFGVGSVLAVVGSPYISRDGDNRLSVSGWWCVEEIAQTADESDLEQVSLDEWE